MGVGQNLNINNNLGVTGVSTFTGAVSVTNATASTLPSNGALIITGGLGVGNNLSVTGNATITGTSVLQGAVSITNATGSTSPTTGALVVTGGMGVGQGLYVGGTITATNLTLSGALNATLSNSLTFSTGLTLDSGSTWNNSAARTVTVSSNTRTRTIVFTIDGGGSVITTGSKGYTVVDYNCNIISWDILGDAAGTLTVDISKASYANFPGTFTASGGTSPALSSAQKNQANINWTGFTTISAGDILQYTVSGSPATVTKVTVSIQVQTNG
jgi:hypothetical protein